MYVMPIGVAFFYCQISLKVNQKECRHEKL